MLQISGYWLLLTSLLHVIVGFWVYGEPLAEIARNGFFNSVAPNPFSPNFAREDAFWFMTLTAFFVILAQLCFWDFAGNCNSWCNCYSDFGFLVVDGTSCFDSCCIAKSKRSSR